MLSEKFNQSRIVSHDIDRPRLHFRVNTLMEVLNIKRHA